MILCLTAQVPYRAGFNLGYNEVLSLPVRLRDKMLEQIEEWRAQEKDAENKLKR